MLEESGHTSDDWELLKVVKRGGTRMHWEIYIYLAKKCKKVGEPVQDGGEKIQVLSATIDEFLQIINTNEWREKFITEYFYTALDTAKAAEIKARIAL